MKFCIIGLNEFGMHLARALSQQGSEVMAIDYRQECVETIKDEVSFAATVDLTSPKGLDSLALKDMDGVVVTIVEDLEMSLRITHYLKESGVSRIVCRKINDFHEKLLDLMGIEERISPEQMAGTRLAKSLLLTGTAGLYYFHADYAIVKVLVPLEVVGKTLKEVDFRGQYRLNVITVYRDSPLKKINFEETGKILGVLDHEYTFQKDDMLLLFGREKDIRQFLES